MAKKQETTKQGYHTYCHNCNKSFDSSEVKYSCECGGEALTITNYDKPMSGYFVKGVRV